MKQEQMQNLEERVSEEIRLAIQDYFVGTTRKTEEGFVLDLGKTGVFHIVVARV